MNALAMKCIEMTLSKEAADWWKQFSFKHWPVNKARDPRPARKKDRSDSVRDLEFCWSGPRTRTEPFGPGPTGFGPWIPEQSYDFKMAYQFQKDRENIYSWVTSNGEEIRRTKTS